jgi:RNA polymerase sigma factor (sigma-70 family)
MSQDTTIHIQDCLSRWRNGEARAGDELMMATADRLRHLARRMMQEFPVAPHQADTGDILQSAQLRLWKALQKSIPESPRHFLNLAAQLIRHELIDLTRHYFRADGRGAHEVNVSPNSTTSSEPLQPAEPSTLHPVRLSQWGEFHERVEKLPDNLREVMQLLWYQGRTKAEAAELMGVDIRTVYRYWNDAWKELGSILD